MPINACLWFYECTQYKTLLKPLKGDCGVFLSYATVLCSPIQEGDDNYCRQCSKCIMNDIQKISHK